MTAPVRQLTAALVAPLQLSAPARFDVVPVRRRAKFEEVTFLTSVLNVATTGPVRVVGVGLAAVACGISWQAEHSDGSRIVGRSGGLMIRDAVAVLNRPAGTPQNP